MTETEHAQPTPLDRITWASKDIQAARAQLHEEQEDAWQRYVATVELVLADDLSETVQGPVGDATDSVHELIATVRGQLDDLRLQAHLGRMEGKDLLEDVQTAVAYLVDHLRP